MAAPSQDAIREALRSVVDPELGDDIVSLGMVGGIEVSDTGRVGIEVSLTVASCPLRGQIDADAKRRVASLPGVTEVDVHISTMDPAQKRALMDKVRLKAAEGAPDNDIPASARILAIASGKGGVGKSSVTVNLAWALADLGMTVGILDADIWGFSVPRLLGLDSGVGVEGTPDDWGILPTSRPVGAGLIKVVSMGLIAEREDEAIMWRGLVLTRALQHFVQDVRWGELDYLLIDMPPGTGDIQMGLARLLPRAEVVIVTTPPQAAARVAIRAADMARKGHLRIAGVVENMHSFTCEHGATYALFGEGGGASLANLVGAPVLGTIPFHPSLGTSGDEGLAGTGLADPIRDAFAKLAGTVASELAPIRAQGCTARMLDTIEAALGER